MGNTQFAGYDNLLLCLKSNWNGIFQTDRSQHLWTVTGKSIISSKQSHNSISIVVNGSEREPDNPQKHGICTLQYGWGKGSKVNKFLRYSLLINVPLCIANYPMGRNMATFLYLHHWDDTTRSILVECAYWSTDTDRIFVIRQIQPMHYSMVQGFLTTGLDWHS